jgi:UDP-N-acetylglucosamine 2-epimerase (non-hydrolysing)
MVSTYPRTRVKLEALGRGGLEGVTLHEPFDFLDFNKLQLEVKCVISDSGTIIEEAAISEFKAVSIRGKSSRAMPEGYESNNSSTQVVQFLFSTVSQLSAWKNVRRTV